MANIFITGMTGTGKTTLAGRLIAGLDTIVYGFTNKEEDVDLIERISGRKFQKRWITDSTRIKYLPDFDVFFVWSFITHENRIRFMDEFARIMKQFSNRVLLIDEAHEVLPSDVRYSRELESLIAGGRIKGIHVILITQRPQNIRKSVLNNCMWKITFKLNEPNAIHAMSENMEGISENDIKALSLYEYIVYNAYTGEIFKEGVT